jgi:hypothetical protein
LPPGRPDRHCTSRARGLIRGGKQTDRQTTHVAVMKKGEAPASLLMVDKQGPKSMLCLSNRTSTRGAHKHPELQSLGFRFKGFFRVWDGSAHEHPKLRSLGFRGF